MRQHDIYVFCNESCLLFADLLLENRQVKLELLLRQKTVNITSNKRFINELMIIVTKLLTTVQYSFSHVFLFVSLGSRCQRSV